MSLLDLNPVTAIVNLVSEVFDRLTPNKPIEEKDRFALELTKTLQESELIKKFLEVDQKQIDVNIEQAKSTSFFVSGARPYIMWGLGTIVIFYGFLTTIVNFAVAFGYHIIPMPPLDPMIRDITLGLLGLGHLTRSFDKWKNPKK